MHELFAKLYLSLICDFAYFVLCQKKDDTQKILFKKDQIVFSLQTLIEATGGFSSNNKIGEVGFGSVYKVCIYVFYLTSDMVKLPSYSYYHSYAYVI